MNAPASRPPEHDRLTWPPYRTDLAALFVAAAVSVFMLLSGQFALGTLLVFPVGGLMAYPSSSWMRLVLPKRFRLEIARSTVRVDVEDYEVVDAKVKSEDPAGGA